MLTGSKCVDSTSPVGEFGVFSCENLWNYALTKEADDILTDVKTGCGMHLGLSPVRFKSSFPHYPVPVSTYLGLKKSASLSVTT